MSFFAFIPSLNANEITRLDIEEFAKNFINSNIAIQPNVKRKITSSKIDPRVQIKPCTEPLTAKLPKEHNNRNINLKVICPSSMPWHMFITVKIRLIQPVVVASEQISRGSMLDTNNVEILFIEEKKIRGETVDDINEIVGAKAKRSITKGKAITKRNICLVCKGESVNIVAKSESFMIKTDGIAMSNGSIGEQIKVKNTRSGRTVTATVTGVNKVIINL